MSEDIKQENNIKDLENIIQELEANIKERENEYKLKLADLENTRKRLEKASLKSKELANERIISNFLDLLDDFTMALEHKTGYDMVYSKFKNMLEAEGLKELESEEFNPEMHHAIAVEKGPNKLEVIRKGYRLKDKIIRPSLVKIFKED